MKDQVKNMHVLVAGWFSFEQMGTTAGDLMARDLVCGWLKEGGISFKVAAAGLFPYPGSVNWQTCDASVYTDVVFVCGPFGNGWPLTEFLQRFTGTRLTGVNLSLLESLDRWNPFTLLLERDSSRMVQPDITFSAPPPEVPVVGVILVHKQKEYGNRALHERANAAIERLIAAHEMSVVRIDTALENNAGGLRTAGEVEALIARMDVVLTTRLHGTVLALKNGVPVIPIDPIKGGAKITSQVKCIGWPLLFQAEVLDDETLSGAFRYCLSEEARFKAKECARKAGNKIEVIRKNFIEGLQCLRKENFVHES